MGRLAIVPGHLHDANITQDTARIGIIRGDQGFYRHYLETSAPRRHFSVNTLGVAVQGINLRDVRTTPIPLVGQDEQRAIIRVIEESERSKQTMVEDLIKLDSTKQGLMHDLLTGRVRVPMIDNIERAADV